MEATVARLGPEFTAVLDGAKFCGSCDTAVPALTN
jgi:hypothetical protein